MVSNAQIQTHKKEILHSYPLPPVPLPPVPLPPPPLAINKRYVIDIFVLFQAVIQGGNSREVPKSCSNTLILE